jgi:hypothetical protein
MAVALRCPRCRQRFHWDVEKGWPRYCQIKTCGADISQVGQDDDNVIAMPAFLTKNSKVPDQVAREVMDSSERRAETAAQMAGGTAADYSDLKITDLTDKPHEMLSPMVPVSNPVTQFIQQNPQAVAAAQANGPQYSAQAHVGKFPYAGSRTMGDFERVWNKTGSRAVERPSLQTQELGYAARPKSW